MTSLCPAPEAARRAPLGTALDDDDKAPQILLRAGNVVPFEAARARRGAAPALTAHAAVRSASPPAAIITAARETLPGRRRLERLSWTASLALALAVHAAAAAALLLYWPAQDEQVAGAPLILVELAPVPVAPAVTPSEAPPGPRQMQTEAAPPAQPQRPEHDAKREPQKPDEPAAAEALPETPKAEQPVAVLPPPRPAEKPQRHERPPSRAQHASAPSSARQHARRAAAPAPAASSGNPAAVSNWKSRLLARLERYKRYPADAQARGEHGVAQLAFSIDRAGRVHRARIVRSSGSRSLDRATLALVQRAQPLPPPPPGVGGSQIAIVVPIRYNIR